MNFEKFIDFDFIEEIKNLNEDENDSFFIEIVDEFQNQCENLIENIKKLIPTKDLSILKIIHTIKGISANMGALYLSQIAINIETKLKNNDWENIEASIKQLEDVYEETLKQLNALK